MNSVQEFDSSTAGSGRLKPCWLSFGIAVVLLLGLALFFCTGVIASDDTLYLEIARHWRPGDAIAEMTSCHGRIAMWYPIRVATWLMGDSWRSLIWLPLLSAGIALAAVAVAGRRWFGNRAALVAVVSLGLTTHFLIGATIALPDIVTAAAVAVAVALVGPILLQKQCRRAWLPALVSGLVIGVGYSAKEVTALLVPSLGLFVLLRRAGSGWAWRRLGLVGLGALLWLVFEGAFLWHYTGDPLFHYSSARDSQVEYGAALTELTLVNLLEHWTEYARWLMDPGYAFRWWGPVYLAAVMFALVKSNDKTRLLLCVLLGVGSYLSVGSSDLGSYYPLWHQPRYLVPLMPIGALLIGYAVDWLWQGRRMVVWPTAVVAVGLVVGSLFWANQLAGRWYAAREFTAGRMLFSRFDPPPVWRNRICASGHTGYRLKLLFEEAELGEILRIEEPPQSATEWSRRFGGWYVVVSGPDRRSAEGGSRRILLPPASVAALADFGIVASAAPPSTRAGEVFARLKLVPLQTDPADRIDVFKIPVHLAEAGYD